MQKASPAPRIEWADFAKGVAIILVVLGHATEPCILKKLIFVFHMPFFFVTAGFLLNLSKWGSAQNFKPFAAKLFWRLLVPYYLAEILWYPIWFVVCHGAGYLSYWNWCNEDPLRSLCAIFVGNGNGVGLILLQLWFLPSLLCAEIIFVKLFARLNKFGAKIFASGIVLAALIGLSVKNFFVLPMGCDVALVAQIFLLAGVMIRKYNVVDRIGLKICAGLTLILIAAFIFNEHVDMNNRIYGNALMFYAGGLSGTLLLMKLSVLVTKVGGQICALIKDCGRQSMMILVMHPIIANIFYEVIVRAADFPPEKLFADPTAIFFATCFGTLIPLFVAKKFGTLPVLKHFAA